ncbi:MAG: hypothetical protein JXB30_07915 [Anaerolineae bacterium]|nr:hypothetical protein [Anaerolineae bacterium]
MLFRNFLNWLRANLTSFVLSLLLGVTVWIVASQEQNPVEEKEFQSPVPISVEGLGSGLLITNDYPKNTTLRLRAQHNTWLSLSKEDIQVTADLTGLGPGTHHVPLDIDIAERTRLVFTNPSSIQVDIEEERQREMPIHVNLTEPATGYAAETPIIDPPRVIIQGPRSAVDLVSDVQADASLAGLQENFSARLQLVAVDADGNEIDKVTVEPDKAQVTVPIVQKEDYRTLLIVARHTGTPKDGYYVANAFATPNSITVRGDPAIMKGMQPYVETEAVNVSGLTDNWHTNVELDLPPGVTPVEARPVQVNIIIEPLQGNRPLEIPVQTIGLGDNLEAILSPETVTVILAGPLPILEQLNIPEDIIVTVDLTGLAVGTHQLRPEVDLLRADIVIESKFPAVISVTISRTPGR